MNTTFPEVIERFRRGRKMKESDFDLVLYRETERIKKTYDISYRPDTAVAVDEAMADSCFEAGKELFAAVGVYCIDSQTVAQFSQHEMEGAAIVAVASACAGLLVNKASVVVPTATLIKNFTRVGLPAIWVGTLALQALNRNASLVIGGFICDHPIAGPGADQYFYETAAGTIPEPHDPR